jgi:hypothetical protein
LLQHFPAFCSARCKSVLQGCYRQVYKALLVQKEALGIQLAADIKQTIALSAAPPMELKEGILQVLHSQRPTCLRVVCRPLARTDQINNPSDILQMVLVALESGGWSRLGGEENVLLGCRFLEQTLGAACTTERAEIEVDVALPSSAMLIVRPSEDAERVHRAQTALQGRGSRERHQQYVPRRRKTQENSWIVPQNTHCTFCHNF